MIRFTRTGGTRPPRDREILQIEDDGSFTLWRSIGSATFPSTPVGRFAGTLPEETLQQLKAAGRAAHDTGDLTRSLRPGTAIANIQIGDVKAKLGIHDEPEGPWGELLPQLSALLGELTSMPRAALGIAVAEDGLSASLRHLGTEPLSVDLSDLTVRAVLWKGYLKVGDWFAPTRETTGSETIESSEGWQYALPFDHGFELDEAHRVVAYVTLAIADGERLIPIKLSSE